MFLLHTSTPSGKNLQTANHFANNTKYYLAIFIDIKSTTGIYLFPKVINISIHTNLSASHTLELYISKDNIQTVHQSMGNFYYPVC